jgi:hypothetical protein
MDGTCGMLAGDYKFIKNLVGKVESKMPLWRCRSRWLDNSKLNLKGIGYNDKVLIHLARHRAQLRILENNIEPLGTISE